MFESGYRHKGDTSPHLLNGLYKNKANEFTYWRMGIERYLDLASGDPNRLITDPDKIIEIETFSNIIQLVQPQQIHANGNNYRLLTSYHRHGSDTGFLNSAVEHAHVHGDSIDTVEEIQLLKNLLEGQNNTNLQKQLASHSDLAINKGEFEKSLDSLQGTLHNINLQGTSTFSTQNHNGNQAAAAQALHIVDPLVHCKGHSVSQRNGTGMDSQQSIDRMEERTLRNCSEVMVNYFQYSLSTSGTSDSDSDLDSTNSESSESSSDSAGASSANIIVVPFTAPVVSLEEMKKEVLKSQDGVLNFKSSNNWYLRRCESAVSLAKEISKTPSSKTKSSRKKAAAKNSKRRHGRSKLNSDFDSEFESRTLVYQLCYFEAVAAVEKGDKTSKWNPLPTVVYPHLSFGGASDVISEVLEIRPLTKASGDLNLQKWSMRKL